jgi:hypothetical protein
MAGTVSIAGRTVGSNGLPDGVGDGVADALRHPGVLDEGADESGAVPSFALAVS